MSLLAEVSMEVHYNQMRNAVTMINRSWNYLDNGEQHNIRELGNDVYDTWDKLNHAYSTHDEEQFEYVMALFLSLMDDYEQYAILASLRNESGTINV